MSATSKIRTLIFLLAVMYCLWLVPVQAADPDFGPYMALVQRRIKSAWYPPKNKNTRSAIVTFSVSKTGHISKVHIYRSSNDAATDESCVEAVTHADPLLPLPEGAPESVDIQFNFDYNVFKNGEKLTSKSNDLETESSGNTNNNSDIEDLFAPGGNAAPWQLFETFTRVYTIVAVALGPLLLIIGGLLLALKKSGGKMTLIIGVSLIISLFLTPLMKRLVLLLLESLN
jgi:TonB family protein